MRVKHAIFSFLISLTLSLAAGGEALATPTHQIWIPSTDVQPFMVGHLEIDNYFRVARNPSGGRDPNLMEMGFTLGILPFEKIQMEVGFDYLTNGRNPNDQHPWSGNIKIATPEGSFAEVSPALAIGIYNSRPVSEINAVDAPQVYSGQNIIYGLVAKTLPPMFGLPSPGRLSVGYYTGSRQALVKNDDIFFAHPSKDGALASWDRTISEVSDKLWLGVDYFGASNVDSAVSIGVAWRFTNKIKLLFGYDMYTHKSVAGENTVTTQLGVDFP